MPTASPTERIEALFDEIRARGIPLAGAVDWELAREEFAAHGERYREWLSAGFHGEMGYLERGLERRLDPTKVFPNTRSVVAVAIPYRRNPTLPSDPQAPRYARYLEGPDYHRILPQKLEAALQAWAQRFPSSEQSSRPRWKICVDTSAVLERSWAALCGLGWIGKNSLLIHPQLGSYLFLGVVFLDVETDRSPSPMANYCGNCAACLQGCPTDAIVSPGRLDSRRCIAYLTLEKRGAWDLPDPSIAGKVGKWVAGCDVCQEVCPYNRKPLRLPETWPTDERDSALVTEWDRLLSESEAGYRERISGSALSRVKYPDMARNLRNALQNKKDC